MTVDEALEISARCCDAFLIVSNIIAPPLPSFVGLTLADLYEANRLTRLHGHQRNPDGSITLRTTVADCKLPKLYAHVAIHAQCEP